MTPSYSGKEVLFLIPSLLKANTSSPSASPSGLPSKYILSHSTSSHGHYKYHSNPSYQHLPRATTPPPWFLLSLFPPIILLISTRVVILDTNQIMSLSHVKSPNGFPLHLKAINLTYEALRDLALSTYQILFHTAPPFPSSLCSCLVGLLSVP